MSAARQIVSESMKRAEVDEYLRAELSRAGYGGVEITKTPLGTRLTVYAVRPGMVIGRGEGIRRLAKALEEKFGLFNPQIAVAEVPVPEFNPQIMASKIISNLERGIHFRRACHWALSSIMSAGALGVEVMVSGKLTSQRARREKFRVGYIPKVGDAAMKNVNKAVVYAQMKPGLFGVQVVIVPPTYVSPDRIQVKEAEVTVEPTAEVAPAEPAPEAPAPPPEEAAVAEATEPAETKPDAEKVAEVKE